MGDLDYGRADVLASSMENGDVRVNLGDALTNEGHVADAPWWCSGDGFVSRPNDPSENGGGACTAFWFFDGNQRIATAARDGRYAEKAGSLQPGDRAIVSRGEARFLLKAANDSVTLYTADQTNNNTSMMLSLDGSTGSILISCGTSYIELKNGKVVISSGGASISLDGANVQVFGSHTALNTKTGNLGVVGAIPPPAGVGSIVAGPAGMSGVGSSAWTVAVV